jgi:hypothetical protein
MAKKYTKRVEINRSAVAAVRLVLADGMFAIGQQILANTHPPDDPPYGQGLVEGGGAVVWVDGKKVAGTTIGGRQVAKPRAVRLPKPGIVLVVGYGFPGRFVHNGTIHNVPNPFLARSVFGMVGQMGGIMAGFCRPRLAALR